MKWLMSCCEAGSSYIMRSMLYYDAIGYAIIS